MMNQNQLWSAITLQYQLQNMLHITSVYRFKNITQVRKTLGCSSRSRLVSSV